MNMSWLKVKSNKKNFFNKKDPLNANHFYPDYFLAKSAERAQIS